MVSLLTFLSVFSVKAYPGGTYTINPSATATATNYLTFTDFCNDLRNIPRGDGGVNQYAVGGAGLQGNVTCNVTPGTYTQRLILTAIVGSSATRRVTINGNGAIIDFTPTVATDAGVIDLNGTDFFTFNNLEVRMGQINFGYCYWLRNGADNNIIKNNRLRCNNITGIPLTGSAYIWMSNGTASNLSGNSGNNNLIDSNDMRSSNGLNHGPFYGVNMFGLSAPAVSNAGNNNIVSNNLIRDFHWGGILHSSTYNTTIRNNTITNQGRTSVFGIKYGTYTLTGTLIMENNRIFNLNGNTPQTSTIYPIFISTSNTTVPIMESKVTNNWIYDFGTSTLQCFLLWNSAASNQNISLDVEHNTIVFDYPSLVANTSTIVRNVQGGWFRNFRNNILYNNMGGTGSKWLIHDQATTANSTYRWTTYHNNCLFFGPNAAGNLRYGYGVLNAAGTAVGDLQTFEDMRNASFPASNIATDPNFTSIDPASINLAPQSIEMANKGTFISSVPRDYNGVNRTNPPDIGAFEYTIDVEVTNFTLNFPNLTCSGFSSLIGGTIKNNAPYTINNVKMAYSINRGQKIEFVVPGNIAPNASVNFNFPNQHLFNKSGQTNVRLFLSSPDDNPTNDTILRSANITPAPGGSVLTHNTAESSVFAIYDITGKPDVTFKDEKLVWDFTAPSGVGFNNADYGTKWRAFVSAKTAFGTNANAIASGNGAAPFKVTINPTVAWEDSTIEVTIRVLNLLTFCDTLYKRSVYIAPKAVPDFIIPNPLCERNDIFFENTTTVKVGAVEYEWSFGDGSPITVEASPSNNYATFGTYTIKLKATTKPYNFVTEKIVNIFVTEQPLAQIINTNKCQGENVILRNNTAYGGSGTTQYVWTFSDNSTPISTSTKTIVNKSFANAGAFRVTLAATADGCTDIITKIVYQFAKPIANFSVTKGNCLNDEYEFNNLTTISSGLFGSFWNWNDGGNIATDNTPKYTFTTSGTKNVKYLATSEFGCKDSIIKAIAVKQIPTTDFSYPFACDRTPTQFVNLTNLNGETLTSYTWNLGQGGPVNQNAPLINWSNLGPRTVSLKTILANGCSTEVSKLINVGVQPIIDFDFETHCLGSPIPFTNLSTFPKGIINYKWSFGDLATSTNPAPEHNYASAQTYSVKLVGKIVDGCSDSLTKLVNIAALPQTCDFDITRNWAQNSRNYLLTPKGGALSNLKYTWAISDGNRLNSTSTGANYTFAAKLEYCVTMIAQTTDGCECSATKCIDALSTGINQQNILKVALYPNPSNGHFNISINEPTYLMIVKVYNVLGTLVKTLEFNNSQAELNLSNLNNGVYFVKITANNQTNTQKINIIK